MVPADASGRIRVVVAYSPAPRQTDCVTIELPVGATVADALQESGLLQRHPSIDVATARLGIWGKLKAAQDVLRQDDRVEVYRPLLVDPKEARRQRYKSHRDKKKAPG